MVNIPPPTIPTTPPEPLTIQTALFSLKGIGNIFKDQRQFYKRFDPIIVSCPFAMLDHVGFEKDVYKYMAINKQGTLKKLKVINEWAAGNMQFYDKHIRDREFENPELYEKYYSYCDDQLFGTGFSSANDFPIAEEIVRHPKNKHSKEYPTLFWFYDFCDKVQSFTSDFLSEPAEPDQPAAQVKPEPQPEQGDNPQHPKPKSITGYADKWYALYHMICLTLGKPLPRFESSSKDEIVKYGKEQYKTAGEGFYKGFNLLDINNMVSHVRSLPVKDRPKWKKIIIDISNSTFRL